MTRRGCGQRRRTETAAHPSPSCLSLRFLALAPARLARVGVQADGTVAVQLAALGGQAARDRTAGAAALGRRAADGAAGVAGVGRAVLHGVLSLDVVRVPLL